MARSTATSVYETAADIVAMRSGVNTDQPQSHSDWQPQSFRTDTSARLPPSNGALPDRSVEQQFQTTEEVQSNLGMQEKYEPQSDAIPRKRSADKDSDAISENVLLPDLVTTNPEMDVTAGAVTEGQAVDLGVFQTIETMLRQLDLLDNHSSPSTWRFTLEQGVDVALELFVHSDDTGAWSINVKDSGTHNLEDTIEELRDTLLRRHPNVTAVALVTGDRE